MQLVLWALGDVQHLVCTSFADSAMRRISRGEGGEQGPITPPPKSRVQHARLKKLTCEPTQAWRLYNCEALDFNLFFCSKNSRALRHCLASDDAKRMHLVWEAPKDDLGKYFKQHMQRMRAHFFKG